MSSEMQGDLPPGHLKTLRGQNARRVLEYLLAKDESQGSEADQGSERSTTAEAGGLPMIIEETGLARTTVWTVLNKDLKEILDADEVPRRGPGRRASLWSVAPDAAYTVGLEIGRSHVSLALMNAHGGVIQLQGPEYLPATLANKERVLDLATRMLEGMVVTPERCKLIAALMVGLPGPVDREHGSMLHSGYREWDEEDLREDIVERWIKVANTAPPSIEIENDANLAALAELRWGAGRGAQSLLYVKWSTGISSGLVVGGDVWRGATGAAGELGHVPVRLTPSQKQALRVISNEECPRCGRTDCLESVAGGAALARAVGASDLAHVAELSRDEPHPKRKDAQRALRAAARLIGTALGPALLMLNVDLVVVGGLVGRDAEVFEMVLAELRAGIATSTSEQFASGAQVELGHLGPSAYARGGARLAFDESGTEFLLQRARERSAGAGDRRREATRSAGMW